MLPHLVYRVPVSTGKLVGMSTPPRGFAWEQLRAFGITHLVNLGEVGEDLNVAPLRVLYSCLLEDISGDETPIDPEVNHLHLWKAAFHVWAALREGRGVAVQSIHGRNRAGAVLAATLRLRRLPAERAIEVVAESIRGSGAESWSGATWHVHQIQDIPGSLAAIQE